MTDWKWGMRKRQMSKITARFLAWGNGCIEMLSQRQETQRTEQFGKQEVGESSNPKLGNAVFETVTEIST